MSARRPALAFGAACALIGGLPTQRAAAAPLLRSNPDTTGPGVVAGTVRSGISGLGVPGAQVDVGGAGVGARADSGGAYILTGLPPGPAVVRVTSRGFDTLVLQVLAPAHGTLQVDITLSPTLVVLDSIHVNAVRPLRATSPLGSIAALNGWGWRGRPGNALGSSGEPDAFRALGEDPHLPMRPDWASSLADRGGSSDQVLVRVDGVPVWSPAHAGGTLSTISPDAIASLDLHDGAMPATYGDRLGGVLDIRTRDGFDDGATGTVALGPAAARATWARPITVGGADGSVLVAVRRSDFGLPAFSNSIGPLRDQWADGVATASLGTGPTTLRLLAMASGDLATPAADLMPAIDQALPTIPWHTQTAGIVWDAQLSPTARLESHASSTAFGARVRGAGDPSSPTLANAVQQSELGTHLEWGPANMGLTFTALNASYRVSPGATTSSVAGASGITGCPLLSPFCASPLSGGAGAVGLQLIGAPKVVTAFADRRWGPRDSAWSVTTGVRGMAVLGAAARLEPRIDAQWRIATGVVAAVGYARTHQIVQSLRNAESPYGAQIAIDLPAAGGSIPIAQGDAGTAGVTARLGSAARLSVDGYIRALSGLAVADPLHNALFATTLFDRASAHIAGLGVTADGESGLFMWQAAYGLGRTVESSEGVRYHPTSELGHSASAALGLWLGRFTQARLAAWAAFGQQAPGLDVTTGGRDEYGAGEPAPSAPDRALAASWAATTQLPPYIRVDLELAHTWRTGWSGGRLSTFATLANLMNHANVAAEVPGPTGALRGVTLLPRTLLFGVSWEY